MVGSMTIPYGVVALRKMKKVGEEQMKKTDMADDDREMTRNESEA